MAMTLVVQELGRIEYGRALALQQELLAARLAEHVPDQLLLLEHDPVYTLGRGADAADLCGADERLGVPVFRVGRGGGVTFHGPGQLVAYPIIKLGSGRRDVHRYMRCLEDVVIATCSEFGVVAERCPDTTGVWVGEAKIASLGVGLRRWVTYHGLALNVATDLRFFRAIVPCRMPALRVTSLAELLAVVPSLPEVGAVLARRFRETFETSQPGEAAA
ncbi:MAG: lipoyl(octanoyl) transferase LipB [Deltaproteobacteria bacterium]|nr:lipoyl(octanoyl) transferase LipB [Deltaproteobacteria bacterium]